MREPEAQIENSGYRYRKRLGQMHILGPLASGQSMIERQPSRSADFGFSSTHSTKWSSSWMHARASILIVTVPSLQKGMHQRKIDNQSCVYKSRRR